MYDLESMPLPPNAMGAHPFDNGELRIRDELLEAFPRLPDKVRRHIAEYYAMITHLDACMGRVLEALERAGQTENTIIVFAGDNGLAVGQHGLMGKQNLYDHSVRVPLILAGPGVPAGEKRDSYCYLFDIFPTLCDLVGAETPGTVDGKSLKPVLQDTQVGMRDTLYCAYRNLQRSVRDRRYKLIEYVVEGKRTTQLFDLEKDPWELYNLAAKADQSERLASMRQRLEAWAEATDDNLPEHGAVFWDGYRATLKSDVVPVSP
jgi:Arylsulfatase A and related enzymes